MRKCLLAAFVVFICATGAFCQPGAPPPPQPAPSVPGQLPMPLSQPATPSMVTGLPPVDFALSLPETLGKPFTFVLVLLLVGGLLMVLVRRVTMARLSDPRYARTADGKLQRNLALGDLIVWVVALHAACEAIAVNWFTSLTHTLLQLAGLVFGLLGAVIGGLFWVAAAGLLAYAISPRGRDIVLSLLGFFYLRWHSDKPSPTQEFDLGGGVRAHLVRTDLLQSMMQAVDGKQYFIPNAWLMRTHFNWDRESFMPPDTRTASPPPPPAEQAFPVEGYPGIAGTGQPK